MKTFWKRAGWTGMSILPLITSLVLQFGMGVAWVLLYAILAGFQAGMSGVTDMAQIQNSILSNLMDDVANASSAMIFSYHILSLPVFGLWYYLGCGRPKAAKLTQVLRSKCVLSAVIGGIGLCLFANVFVLLSQYIFPRAFQTYSDLVEAAGFGVNILAIIASVILAPIGEEILCRGIIFHYAKKVTEGMKNRTVAFWIANGIQALMFGIMHANFIQGAFAFVIGLVLGWLRERYHSLYPAMLTHFVVNFLSSFVIGYIFIALPESVPAYVLLGVVSIGIIGVAVWIGREMEEV